MIVKVALQVPPNYLLDYSVEVSCQSGDSQSELGMTDVNKNHQIKLFDRVLVQVGKRELVGFVVAKDISVDYSILKVKPITKFLDSPISKDMQKLILWLARYYCCDLYNAIRLALPNDYFKDEVVAPKQDIYIFQNQSQGNPGIPRSLNLRISQGNPRILV